MIHESVEARPTARERTRALRTEEILVAARDLVVSEGVEAVTVQRVAKALGYVPAALYRYYPSKEALMAALIGRALKDLGGALQAAVEAQDRAGAGARRSGAAAMARVLACVDGFLDWARRAPHEATLVALALADPRVLVPQQDLALGVASEAGAGVGVLVDALQSAVDAGALRDAPPVMVAALLLTAAVLGVWSLQKMTRLAPGALDVNVLARTQARVVLAGMGARAAVLEAAVSQRMAASGGGSWA